MKKYILIALLVFSIGCTLTYAVEAQSPTVSPLPQSNSISTTTGRNPAESMLCGATGQACCQPKWYQWFSKECFFDKDEPTKYDKNGIRIPEGDMSRTPESCRCKPRVQVYGADNLCSRYFTPSNYSRIVEPGILDPDTNAILTQDQIDRINGELDSCLKCVQSNGFYTALGCMPFEINSLIKGIIIVGMFAAGILSLLCIIFGAIKIQTSKGDATKVSKAQESIRSCILGLILIIFSAFIVNILGSGLLGFSIVEPFKQVLDNSKNPKPVLECDRQCIYSEQQDTGVKCYTGACPENEPNCGMTKGKPDKNSLNGGCKFADSCGNFKEVACPAMPSLTPQPSPAPTPPPTGTITPPPGTITPGPVTPGPGTPIPGGPSLVTEQMIADAVLFHTELAKSCTNELHVFDMSCVDKVNIPIANLDVIKAQIKNEMSALYKANKKLSDFQCVGYIKAFMSLYTGQKGGTWPSTNSTAASLLEPLIVTYPGFKQYELAFINKNVAPPLPGDFAKFRDYDAKGNPGAGHIAFVNGTINGAQFTVLQANLGAQYTTCNGCISAMVVERSNPLLTGYYRWQKKP